MNSETIQKIDLKWNDMFTQELISSPSLKYKILTSNEGAIYEQ